MPEHEFDLIIEKLDLIIDELRALRSFDLLQALGGEAALREADTDELNIVRQAVGKLLDRAQACTDGDWANLSPILMAELENALKFVEDGQKHLLESIDNELYVLNYLSADELADLLSSAEQELYWLVRRRAIASRRSRQDG